MIEVIASRDRRIPAGSQLISINNHKIEDFLDFRFNNDPTKSRELIIEKDKIKKKIRCYPTEPIRISIKEPSYRTCENDCDFCFLKGLPKGLRKELYFRDDDYRLSFLFGNFLSLTNISDRDIRRIDKLRLSPLYISVHATDPRLRKKIFKNRKAALILEWLAKLADRNIKMHCQIVVIPGLNDGASLVQSINDLSAFYPAVESIGIVPVGRTKYSKHTPEVSKTLARKIVELSEKKNRVFRKKYGKGLVYLADEFYIKTGSPIPGTSYYDGFPQYENGIGMVRYFLDEVRTITKFRKTKGRFLMITGELVKPYIDMFRKHLSNLTGKGHTDIDVLSVKNTFFGNSVTVAGLLSAGDFFEKISKSNKKYDRIFLPPNCVNDSDLFIDEANSQPHNLAVSKPQNRTGPKSLLLKNKYEVIIAPPRLKDLVKWLQ